MAGGGVTQQSSGETIAIRELRCVRRPLTRSGFRPASQGFPPPLPSYAMQASCKRQTNTCNTEPSHHTIYRHWRVLKLWLTPRRRRQVSA